MKFFRVSEEKLNQLIGGLDSLPTNFRHSHIVEIMQFIKQNFEEIPGQRDRDDLIDDPED